MRLTKQQKIYAAVLGVAVLAFGFDRFVLGPGQDDSEAEAAAVSASRTPAHRAPGRPTPAATVSSSPATAGASATLAGSGAGASTLAARFQRVARADKTPLNLERVGDAFRPSPVWIVADTTSEAVREFQKHKLTAVMKRAGRGIAILEKKTLTVGQVFDGFRLVAVKDRSAVFQRGKDTVELHLPKDEALAGGGLATQGGGTSEKVAGVDKDN